MPCPYSFGRDRSVVGGAGVGAVRLLAADAVDVAPTRQHKPGRWPAPGRPSSESRPLRPTRRAVRREVGVHRVVVAVGPAKTVDVAARRVTSREVDSSGIGRRRAPGPDPRGGELRIVDGGAGDASPRCYHRSHCSHRRSRCNPTKPRRTGCLSGHRKTWSESMCRPRHRCPAARSSSRRHRRPRRR